MLHFYGAWVFIAAFQVLGSGPNDFQINKTAAAVGVTSEMIGPGWRLQLRGDPRPITLDRAQLLAMPQYTAALPIACVESWSTQNQPWTALRVNGADLSLDHGYPARVIVPANPWRPPVATMIWFLGAVIFHDFVLFPLYTLAGQDDRPIGLCSQCSAPTALRLPPPGPTRSCAPA